MSRRSSEFFSSRRKFFSMWHDKHTSTEQFFPIQHGFPHSGINKRIGAILCCWSEYAAACRDCSDLVPAHEQRLTAVPHEQHDNKAEDRHAQHFREGRPLGPERRTLWQPLLIPG